MKQSLSALADAEPTAFWLDSPERPDPCPGLVGDHQADLVVVGGGYSGLWTALLAKERNPGTEVILLEARDVAWAASGRNGGFCEASLTHGESNGRQHFAEEHEVLQRLGMENLDAIEASLKRYSINCDWWRTGSVSVATERWQFESMSSAPVSGDDVLLDAEEVRRQLNSPTYLGGVWSKNTSALVNPAKLAWGLKAACLSLGVRIFEGSPARRLQRNGNGVLVSSDHGSVRAPRVALATNAFPSLIRRVRWYTVPVYDYALMTEPLNAEQLNAIGWSNRQGFGDYSNQFHYYRMTADNRILWGGYDAIYYYGRSIRDDHDQRETTFRKLAEHFFTTFPQLEGVRFTHKWGGAIDTCSRFCAFFGTALGDRVSYAVGFTGLGVGATRFGANVMLDLLGNEKTERTDLLMVRRKPIPFPPEPLAYLGIQATRWSLARADRNDGRRNLWLRTLDRLGMGFDS